MTGPERRRGVTPAAWLALLVLLATLLQLAVGAFASLPQFAGKGFGARLVAYPVLMLLGPVLWLLALRLRPASRLVPVPWAAFALMMAPFLVDVTGNTLDLYDAVVWWDDVNHLVNWFLLCAGLGLLLRRTSLRPAWAHVLAVAGLGAVLALLWEVGEWYAFIRHGTELATAYEDTLGDQVLGTLGALVAGVTTRSRARRSGGPSADAPRSRRRSRTPH